MKRAKFSFCLLLAITVSFGQEEEKKSQPSQTKEMEQIILAQQLANYGYSKSDPLALLAAAKIIISNPVTEFNPEVAVVDHKGKKTTSSKVKLMDPEALIEDALKMAGEDPGIRALSQQIKINKAKGSPDGPQLLKGFIGPKKQNEYSCGFTGNELAEVAVVGDGSADLDLYIYDMDNNLIVSDVRSLSEAYCAFIPYITATFRIVVKNLSQSQYSEFLIAVN